MTDLACPYCGGALWLNVSAADPALIECDDATCAAWDRNGKLIRSPLPGQRVAPEPYPTMEDR